MRRSSPARGKAGRIRDGYVTPTIRLPAGRMTGTRDARGSARRPMGETLSAVRARRRPGGTPPCWSRWRRHCGAWTGGGAGRHAARVWMPARSAAGSTTIAVIVLLPLILARREVDHALCASRSRARGRSGVGSSAVATALFTKAFALTLAQYDFVTPLVLQKLQPLFAVALAVVLLNERLRPVRLFRRPGADRSLAPGVRQPLRCEGRGARAGVVGSGCRDSVGGRNRPGTAGLCLADTP